MNTTHQVRLLAVALTLFAFPGVGSAGGPFAPPDGGGNPTGSDYTGYTVYGWVVGVQHNAGRTTSFLCTNSGAAEPAMAVQFWDQGGDPNRDPKADSRSPGLSPSDLDEIRSQHAKGVVHEAGIARILIEGPFNPAVYCRAYVLDGNGDIVAALKIVENPPPKKKKKRRRR